MSPPPVSPTPNVQPPRLAAPRARSVRRAPTAGVPTAGPAATGLSEALIANAHLQPHAAAVVAPGSIAWLQSHSLTSAVHAEIERLILEGELLPGSKLTEAALAQRLGVSRGPLREAFRRLEEAGLVRLEKNRGAFVRAVPLHEALEIYDLRAMLEAEVCRTLAQCITSEQLQALRQQVERMERLVREDAGAASGDAYHRLNLDFHDQLVRCAGNAQLLRVYRRLVRELSLFRHASVAEAAHRPVSVSEHRGILKAVSAGDAEAAAQAARSHVLQSKARTLRLQQSRTAALAAAPVSPPLRSRHA